MLKFKKLLINAEWATKCNYWVRFTTTATLGLIYRGCYEKTNEVLSAYLPGSIKYKYFKPYIF